MAAQGHWSCPGRTNGPDLALALRALLQQAIDDGCPIVVSVRGDATADEISALQARIEALIQQSGLAA